MVGKGNIRGNKFKKKIKHTLKYKKFIGRVSKKVYFQMIEKLSIEHSYCRTEDRMRRSYQEFQKKAVELFIFFQKKLYCTIMANCIEILSVNIQRKLCLLELKIHY